MGLLKTTRMSLESMKQKSDDILLLHSMICVVGAGEKINSQTRKDLHRFYETLPESEGECFESLYKEAVNVRKKYDCVEDSLKALKQLSSSELKKKCFTFAANVAEISHVESDEQTKIIMCIKKILKINDDFANQVLKAPLNKSSFTKAA